jgi:hypothetical protein
MYPIPKPQLSPVVNWSIHDHLNDQFPAAVVVINCPPFRGTIDRLPPSQPYWPRPLPTPTGRSLAAVLGYAVAERAESITRQKRHRLTTAKSRASSGGGANVLYF